MKMLFAIVAEKLLHIGTVTVSGHTMTILRPPRPVEQEQRCEVVQQEPEQELEHVNPAPQPVLSTVVVSGLKPKINSDILTMYFENQKRSGGGVIKNINVLVDERKAVVEFEDPEGCSFVILKHFGMNVRMLVLDYEYSKIN